MRLPAIQVVIVSWTLWVIKKANCKALGSLGEVQDVIKYVESHDPKGAIISGDDEDLPSSHLSNIYRNEVHHKNWMNSGKFQGDIAGVDPRIASSAGGVFRNAVKDRSLLWGHAIIPYVIGPQFTSSEIQTIKGAFDAYHFKTCIRFAPRTSEPDYLYVYKDYGCYSLVGRVGGRQELSLGRGCMYHEIIVHELMHTLGFWHEHSRPDRDSHIRIHWENVIPGMNSQFDKIDYAYTNLLDEGYDYLSIMHYDSTAFSKNGQITIEAMVSDYTKQIGKALELSDGDVRRINHLYECRATPIQDANPPPPPAPTVIDPQLLTRNTRIVPPPTDPPHIKPFITISTEPCNDKFLDCPFFQRYCTRQSFFLVMQLYCPKTCNHC